MLYYGQFLSNCEQFKTQIIHKYVSLCSIMDNSFQYGRMCHTYLHYFGENKLVQVFSAGMSGLFAKNVRDPRSQDPTF